MFTEVLCGFFQLTKQTIYFHAIQMNNNAQNVFEEQILNFCQKQQLNNLVTLHAFVFLMLRTEDKYCTEL